MPRASDKRDIATRLAKVEDELRRLKLANYGEGSGDGASGGITWLAIDPGDFTAGTTDPGFHTPQLGYDTSFLYLQGIVDVAGVNSALEMFTGVDLPPGATLDEDQYCPIYAGTTAFGPPVQDHLPDPLGVVKASINPVDGKLLFTLVRDNGFGYYDVSGSHNFSTRTWLGAARFPLLYP